LKAATPKSTPRLAAPSGAAAGNAAAPPQMTEEELRRKLRPVFDRFDADASGFISTDEMRKVCDAIGVELSEAQLQAMMVEADPDQSGAVDFEEFVTVLKKQMAGGGQLADLVSSMSSFFGFLNPFSWFAAKPADPAPAGNSNPAGAPAATATPVAGPKAQKKQMTEEELRSKLRPVFDRFDTDQSGQISTSEMQDVCKAIKLKLNAEQLEAMMVEADPDKSGAIDFEEFVTVLKKQMAAGGQLAEVVSAASSIFGFLNPFNWFASKPVDVQL
jgi:Ca2+-binding EF-hand superfamily protein